MSNKTLMRKILKSVKKDLLKNKEIASPVYYVRSRMNRKAALVTHLHWQDQNSKKRKMDGLQKLCNNVDAGEVIMVSDTYLHNDGGDVPAMEGLCVTFEKSDSFQSLILPYSRNSKNKITFGKEIWNSSPTKMKNECGVGLVK